MSDEAKKDQKAQAGKGFPFTVVRRIVQVLVLLLFLVPVLVAGWGLFGGMVGGDDAIATPAESFPFYGTLSSSTLFGITLLDPFAVLQTIAASKAFDPAWLLGLLPLLVLYGLIRGRVFCGWVCPVNLLLELVDWLRSKLNIKVEEHVLPRHVKAWVALGVLVLSALLSFPVFEALSPIGFINKGLVFGSLAGGLTLLAILLVELFWGHRVWCRAICPLGGFYEVVGKVGLVNVKIDHDVCIGCNKCKHVCLCDPEILDAPVAGEDVIVRAGDCMLCGKCIETCPVHALSITAGRPRA
jgi:ferredoxin-type protein NapH